MASKGDRDVGQPTTRIKIDVFWQWNGLSMRNLQRKEIKINIGNAKKISRLIKVFAWMVT